MFVFVRSTRAVVGVFHPFNGSLVGLGLRGEGKCVCCGEGVTLVKGQIEGYKYLSPFLCPEGGFFSLAFLFFLGPTFNQETEKLGSQKSEGGTLKVDFSMPLMPMRSAIFCMLSI